MRLISMQGMAFCSAFGGSCFLFRQLSDLSDGHVSETVPSVL